MHQNTPSSWIRQEYKTNKDKFEKPFKITIENGTFEQTTQLCLEQNYKGLGCTVWDGSIALAKMFESDSQLIKHLRHSTVLELGAGCGLVGLTLLCLGAKYVLLTDMKVCLPTLKINVDKHSHGLKKDSVQVMSYIWGEDTTALMKPHGKFNIIVGAEVLYDESDSKLLAYSALQLLAEDGVMFVSMGRNRNGEIPFVDVMNENGYNTIEVQKEQLHPKYQHEVIKVIKVIKKIN